MHTYRYVNEALFKLLYLTYCET